MKKRGSVLFEFLRQALCPIFNVNSVKSADYSTRTDFDKFLGRSTS